MAWINWSSHKQSGRFCEYQLMVFCLLIAACSAQPEATTTNADDVVLRSEVPFDEKVKWRECNAQGFETLQNKWWGSYSICRNDVRVYFDTDSSLLGPADLRYYVHTRQCPAGEPAASDQVDAAFFWKSYSGQISDIKVRVAKLLLQVKEPCGKPVVATQFFDDNFDREFRNLAERYWLNRPSEDAAVKKSSPERGRGPRSGGGGPR